MDKRLLDFLSLLLLLFYLPLYLVQKGRGKRFAPLASRFALTLPPPPPPGTRAFWLHAVSVGEVKSLTPLLPLLRRKFPNAAFYLTTTTVTGQEEAKKLPTLFHTFYLPFDLSWVVNKVVRHLRPTHLLLVEGDLWPQLLRAVKEAGGTTLLVSGKLSPRSAKRLSLFPFFARSLFTPLDLLCLQSEEHAARFLPLLPKTPPLHITGNLKFDLQPTPLTPPPWLLSFQNAGPPLLALTCTHPGEEELLLKALLPTPFRLLLAPRHPERFRAVAALLRTRNIPHLLWSRPSPLQGGEKLLLIDQMGVLPACYPLSQAAIVGGSFVPHIGGHNILEPLLYQIPVLFGPFMEAQRPLVTAVLEEKAGLQVTLQGLPAALSQLHTLSSPHFFQRRGGAAQKTLQAIETLELAKNVPIS